MSLPAKNRLRRITVGSVSYYWKVRTDYATKRIKIRIGEVANPGKSLLVEAYYVDGWLTVGDRDTRKNEVEVITPQFVQKAITYALAQGWDEKEHRRFRLSYEKQSFHINLKA